MVTMTVTETVNERTNELAKLNEVEGKGQGPVAAT